MPQGQISCGLRAIDSYFSDRDKDTFSKFELENSEFKESLNQLKCKYFCKDSEECKAFKAYNVSYCFKDVYITKKDIIELLRITPNQANNILKKLKQQRILQPVVGRGRKSNYKLHARLKGVDKK